MRLCVFPHSGVVVRLVEVKMDFESQIFVIHDVKCNGNNYKQVGKIKCALCAGSPCLCLRPVSLTTHARATK